MTCPICKSKTDPSYRPFCSKRCADVDLGKWFTESYRIETDETPDGEEQAPVEGVDTINS